MLNPQKLGRYVPFNILDGHNLTKAVSKIQIHKAKKGTIIFKRGKALQDQFFLLEGEVDLINNDFGVEKVKSSAERSATALNQASPTNVSAIAKSTVIFFTIHPEELDRLVSISQGGMREPSDERSVEMEVSELSDSQDWMTRILQSPLFARIPLPQLQELFNKFDRVYTKKGEKIVKEGARGDYFYVIASGAALITNCSGSVDVELKPGSYFGEEALLSDAPRNATVTMTSDGMLKRLNADDFRALLKEPVLQYINQNELNDLKNPYKILDVRMPIEYRIQHFPGSVNVPLSRLRNSLPQLRQTDLYVVSGEAGNRAVIAAYLLCQAGFDALVLTFPEVDAERQSA